MTDYIYLKIAEWMLAEINPVIIKDLPRVTVIRLRRLDPFWDCYTITTAVIRIEHVNGKYVINDIPCKDKKDALSYYDYLIWQCKSIGDILEITHRD